ncbi:hypothetical protein [Actinoplanes sp. NPDC026619]|uniref:hypothetical protein n=1 Tax=Actinoplanes sp. NPDC026619 TaxID=3155798 RepID=UPI00340130FA
MLWSGSSPLTVVRENMWGFLMFGGVAWLAIAWSVLRLEPVSVADVAGPVVLFGALCEGVRALAGTRTWWLNAGMAGLFAVTGLIILVVPGSDYATPASLVGWFLMVRGALDISVSTMNRGTDRTWGLMMALGVAQASLGFYAAGPLARTAEPMVVLLGGLGLLRAVADLVTALRLREVTAVHHDVLELSPEREAGVAGYSAGRMDFESLPQPSRARHRADAFHDDVMRTTADLDAILAQAGVTGAATHQPVDEADIPPVPDTAESAHEAAVGDEHRR